MVFIIHSSSVGNIMAAALYKIMYRATNSTGTFTWFACPKRAVHSGNVVQMVVVEVDPNDLITHHDHIGKSYRLKEQKHLTYTERYLLDNPR